MIFFVVDYAAGLAYVNKRRIIHPFFYSNKKRRSNHDACENFENVVKLESHFEERRARLTELHEFHYNKNTIVDLSASDIRILQDVLDEAHRMETRIRSTEAQREERENV